ncbi:ABC transporter permease [Cryomorphaceae bacterium 1068]|nr:ABC transporter permease [Cryomorphaceae bacterium 1068]
MKNNLNETIYQAGGVRSAIWFQIIFAIKALFSSHELAFQLAKRDIQATYRQSFLGILWAFIIPLMTTLVWLILNGSGFINTQSTGISYPAYLLSGTMIWAIFADSFNAPLDKTILNKAIITKVNFPREGIILSGVYHSFFNGLIKLVILIPALLFLDISPSASLLLVPIGLFCLVLTGTALGMIITPIGVLYSDIGKALPLLLQFLMYSVPVVYVYPTKGVLSRIVDLNPLTPLIVQTRYWLTGQSLSIDSSFLVSVLLGFSILILGLVAFRIALPKLIERIGS